MQLFTYFYIHIADCKNFTKLIFTFYFKGLEEINTSHNENQLNNIPNRGWDLRGYSPVMFYFWLFLC